ncbi:Glycerophosphoryl diester phosphodiesterase family protein [compost metagenome]
MHPHHHSFEEVDMASAAGDGLVVYAWTVNAEADYQRMIDAGVTGIITDFPGRLKAFLTK